MLVRDADPDGDGAACAAVYGPAVLGSVASFEERAPSAGEMSARIAATRRRWPWLVAEHDGELAGYAYGAEHRGRAAYRWAIDVSVYVTPAHHRHGVGRALYRELLPRLRDQGFHVACAGIALPNPASVGLHESIGFQPVGVYREIGFKFGAWWDVGWWQLTLRERSATPAEPRAPAAP